MLSAVKTEATYPVVALEMVSKPPPVVTVSRKVKFIKMGETKEGHDWPLILGRAVGKRFRKRVVISATCPFSTDPVDCSEAEFNGLPEAFELTSFIVQIKHLNFTVLKQKSKDGHPVLTIDFPYSSAKYFPNIGCNPSIADGHVTLYIMSKAQYKGLHCDKQPMLFPEFNKREKVTTNYTDLDELESSLLQLSELSEEISKFLVPHLPVGKLPVFACNTAGILRCVEHIHKTLRASWDETQAQLYETITEEQFKTIAEDQFQL